MDTKELQRLQTELDKEYWQHKDLPIPEQIRHSTLHLVKLLGKLGTYCEQQEHGIDYPLTQIIEEVIPDLLSHSLRFSNLLNPELEKLYQDRLKKIKERYNI